MSLYSLTAFTAAVIAVIVIFIFEHGMVDSYIDRQRLALMKVVYLFADDLLHVDCVVHYLPVVLEAQHARQLGPHLLEHA